MHFLCIGDIMMDVSVKISSTIAYGGDTSAEISNQGGGQAANVATWLVADKQDVFLVVRVGNDQPGDFLLRELSARGVRHSGRKLRNENTGVVVVIIDDKKERTMFPDSGANSNLSKSDLPDLVGIDAAYLSGYALINPKSRANAVEILQELKSAKIPIVIDPGTVGALRNIPMEEIKNWLSFADVLILNEEEAQFISGKTEVRDCLAELAKSVDVVVIKEGKKGSIAINEEIVETAAETIEAVDTTGAGDSFAAGFMSNWFANHDLKDALNHGAKLARRCIQDVGAWPRTE